jgi:ABC-type multidrug transport system ATPase subunit
MEHMLTFDTVNCSPQATVREALLFSARLRASGFIDRATLNVFVDEVIELVELGPLRDALVGGSGEGNGLSVEQRKRVSVAVELVANPAIVFMDEPTTGKNAFLVLLGHATRNSYSQAEGGRDAHLASGL